MAKKNDTTAPSRNLRLDVLRGLAIFLVLGRHLPEGVTPANDLFMRFGRFWYQIGWSGVDLFFVLSGFLVSRLLYREFELRGQIDVGRFFLRRGLRIWPAYYFMTFFTLIFTLQRMQPMQVLSELIFLQSYVVHIWDHTWTLAIEEHFYLLLGAFAWLVTRRRATQPFKGLFWIWGLAAIGCLVLRFNIPYGDMWPFARTHLRIDALLFGVLLSYYDSFHAAKTQAFVQKWWILLLILSAALLSPIFFLHLGVEPFLPRFGLSFAYLGFAIWVLLAKQAPATPGNFIENAFAKLGVHSYSIYLWHLPILTFLAQPVIRNLDHPAAIYISVFIYITGSCVAGRLSYFFIEKPFLNWREKVLPEPRKR